MRTPLFLFFFSLIGLPFPVFGQCGFTIEPVTSTGCMQSKTEAIFTELVRTTFDGSTVKKTSGNSNWNGGALSTAGVSNGGYSETVITQK